MPAAKWKVVWTLAAQLDLENLLEYIARDHPQTALKWLKKIRLCAATLVRHPRRGRVVPELTHLRGLPFHELIIPPWRLIYAVRGRDVQVLALLDSRMDLEEILYQRLVRVV